MDTTNQTQHETTSTITIHKQFDITSLTLEGVEVSTVLDANDFQHIVV